MEKFPASPPPRGKYPSNNRRKPFDVLCPKMRIQRFRSSSMRSGGNYLGRKGIKKEKRKKEGVGWV